MPKLSKEQRDTLYLMYKHDGFMVIDHGASNVRFGRGVGAERSPRPSTYDLAFLEGAELLTREFDYWQYQFTLTDKGRNAVEELQEMERMEARPPVDRHLVMEALKLALDIKEILGQEWHDDEGVTHYRAVEYSGRIAEVTTNLVPLIGFLRRALDPDAQRSGQWREIPE